MANQTDILTTIIQMMGATKSANELNDVANKADKAGQSIFRLSAFLRIGEGLFLRFNPAAGLAAGGLTSLTTAGLLAYNALSRVGQVMSEGMRIADQYNQSLTRALVLIGNAGGRTSAGALAGFARGRLGTLGIAEESTLNLAGQMAERGFGPRHIGQLLPALQEIEQGSAGRITGQRAMEMFLRVLERPLQQGGGGGGGGGGGRGLLGLATQLGINIRFTGSIERDLNALTQAIHEKFGGVAEALAATASGVHLRFQALLTAAMGRLGSLIETALVPALIFLNTGLLGFIRTADIAQHGGGQGTTNFLKAIGILDPTLTGFFALTLAQQREREAALARKTGGRGSQEMLDTLHHIEANTQRMASAIATTVFGNVSAFTRGATTYRNLNAAIRFG